MVSDIAFTNVHCTCLTPLFSKKYLRSHRSNGTKVLRCFPHCCPTHVDGTYCGSPLAVVVTVASPGKLTQCSVDFRIESSNDTTMSCGDTVESHRVVANRRHPSNPSAEWLPTRVVAKKANATTFECNPYEGWNYGWKGGSSIHQRLSWHRIKAYVFKSDPDHPETFQVIATVASPPFFVMSYRRSCKACQTNEATGSSRDNCDCAGVFRLSDSLLQEALSTGVTQVDILPLMANRQPHLETNNNASHVAAQERDLRMVFAVLSLAPIPASDAALCELLHWFGSAVATGTPSRPQKTHDIVALCVHVVLALVVQGRQDVRAYMTEHSSDLLHQDLLWQRYELWLQLVTDKMDAHLNAINVLRLAFTQALTTSCHVSHPSGYDTSTSKAPSPVSEFFVAQLREVYMARTTPPQQPPATTERCAWNGSWELDIDSVRVDTLSKGAAASPSLLSLLRCFTMGYRFDQHIANQTLSVLSSLAIFPSKRSEFILDQTPRVFRVFPNGETSMSNCGGLTYGDYMGSLDGSTIRLDLFCWPTASPPTCTLVRLCVQAKSTLLLVTMDVAVHANSHAPADGMDEWTPSERVQHLHQHSPSGVPWLRVMGSYARRSKFNVNEGL